jgi:hypothetical protein
LKMSNYGPLELKMIPDLKPETRKWIYGIIAALVPLLVTLGTLSEPLAGQILTVVAAILTVGGSALAIKNVPSGPDES